MSLVKPELERARARDLAERRKCPTCAGRGWVLADGQDWPDACECVRYRDWLQAAHKCPRGGEIVDYTIGLCSCGKCESELAGGDEA